MHTRPAEPGLIVVRVRLKPRARQDKLECSCEAGQLFYNGTRLTVTTHFQCWNDDSRISTIYFHKAMFCVWRASRAIGRKFHHALPCLFRQFARPASPPISEKRVMIRIISVRLILGMALILGGCTSVYLRHPETGETVKCGPYFGEPGSDHSARVLQRGCIEDYERQGYERMIK